MKNYWYLVASLPMLRIGEKPPVSAAAFRAACAGELPEQELSAVDAVLDGREPSGGADAAGLWWRQEVQLRNAVVRLRAKHRGGDAARFLRPHDGFSVSIEKMVTDAFTRSDPQEQELELDRARWGLADSVAAGGVFGFPGVLAYAVKLRIAGRWAGLDAKAGGEQVESLIGKSLNEVITE